MTIEQIGELVHEINRIYCNSIGDTSQVPWSEAPAWQRESVMIGLRGVAAGNTPEQSHELWLETKRADGWVYGECKDPEAKTHPCMIPYVALPEAQRVKDDFFVTAARLLMRPPSATEGRRFDTMCVADLVDDATEYLDEAIEMHTVSASASTMIKIAMRRAHEVLLELQRRTSK